jgi:hypothetical protein
MLQDVFNAVSSADWILLDLKKENCGIFIFSKNYENCG